MQCLWVYCPHPPRFSGGCSPGNRNRLRLRGKITATRQILKNASNPNWFSTESRTIVTMKTTLPAVFSAAVHSTAIQSSDQQKKVEVFTAFELLFLSLTNLLAGMDGSVKLCWVSAKCASCNRWHSFTALANSGRCLRGFRGPSAFKQRTQCSVF